MAKHLIQVVIVGAQVVGKAFARALRQEINASRQAAASAGGGRQGAERAAANSRVGMTLDEAYKILNVDPKTREQAELLERFDHLFKMNEKSKGGSFYLQSKVVRARERIEEEIGPLEKPKASATDANTQSPLSNDNSSTPNSTTPKPPP